MTNQAKVRQERDRRRHLFAFEGMLNEGHRNGNGHEHPKIDSRGLVVTRFVSNEDGKLKEVRTVFLAKER